MSWIPNRGLMLVDGVSLDAVSPLSVQASSELKAEACSETLSRKTTCAQLLGENMNLIQRLKGQRMLLPTKYEGL